MGVSTLEERAFYLARSTAGNSTSTRRYAGVERPRHAELVPYARTRDVSLTQPPAAVLNSSPKVSKCREQLLFTRSQRTGSPEMFQKQATRVAVTVLQSPNGDAMAPQ